MVEWRGVALRCADGFPQRIPHDAKCRCWACMAGYMRRRHTTQVAEQQVDPSDIKPGTKWFFDISRDWEPDLWGNVAFVLFSDADVTYICVYPITSHTEFFDIAERHVRYVSRTLGKKVVKLSADYDPTWSNPVAQAWVGAANARCEAFEYEYDVSIHRSPPYTHNLNHSERFMGRIAAMANQQMLYAHLSPQAFWWTAVFSAAMIHNLGPVESKTRRAHY